MRNRRWISILAALVVAGALSAYQAARVQAGGGGHCPEPASDAAGTRVDLKASCMLPTVLRVDEGATVRFTNRDEVPHTVTGAGPRERLSWGSFDELRQEQSVDYTFARNGVYLYYCALHPGMVGAIVVGDGSGPGPASAAASVPPGDAPTLEQRRVAAAVAGGGATRADVTRVGASAAAAAALIVGVAAAVLWRGRHAGA